MDEVESLASLDEQVCYAIYSASLAIQRAYKPVLDELEITYPQYLVLNVLWSADEQSVGRIAERLALESSTLTPLLKRLETAGLVRRIRNPEDERQVLIALTEKSRALRSRAGCLGERLLSASGMSMDRLARLNAEVRELRDGIYRSIGGWSPGGD
jgi:MarR family transcriptional regulator, organic hydroperoxide resistance regulator